MPDTHPLRPLAALPDPIEAGRPTSTFLLSARQAAARVRNCSLPAMADPREASA